MKIGFLSVLLILFFPAISFADPPPYQNSHSSFEVISESDPTVFVNSTDARTDYRYHLDKRVEGVPDLSEVYLVDTFFSDGRKIEFNVHMEYGSPEAARSRADFFATELGRLPYEFRSGIEIVWLNKGRETFGVGVDGIIIHDGIIVENYIDRGVLQEALAHETSHTSIDPGYCNSEAWREAQMADGGFISVYGELNPDREDCTESFLAYFALRYRPDLISEEDIRTIKETIPHRIAFYDSMSWNMAPFTWSGFLINAGLNDAWYNPATDGQGFLITVFPDIQEMFVAWFTYDTERPPEDVTAMLGEPGHRWLTALGTYDGETANLTIYETKGGMFDQAQPPATTDQAGIGEMTIEFADCTEGLVTYEIPSLDLTGEIPIQRIVQDNVALCRPLSIPPE